jgi:triphosphatase
MTDTTATPQPAPDLTPTDWSAKTLAFPAIAPDEKHATLFQIAATRRNEVADYLRHAAEGKSLTPDYVHDLRVSLRRLTEVAGLLTVLMDKTSARAVEESLRTLRKAAGNLRDLDVTAEHLAKWRMPAPLKKAARQLVERQNARRPDLEQGLRAAATSASIAGTLVLLARILEEQSQPDCLPAAGAKLEKELEKRLAQRRKKLKKDFGKAARKQRAETLHEARIAAKKLRYIVELEKELDKKGNKHKKELKFLKAIQQLLGDHHDLHVIEQSLQKEITAKRAAPIKNLHPAWRKWHRDMEKKQAERAAGFFMRTYAWLNQ